MHKLAKHPMLICLMLDALYGGGRMFVGATSALYLLANGCSLAQLAYLKLIQGSIFLLAEVPTGAFADLHGRKKSLMISCALSLFGFSLYFLGRQFLTFALAEIFVALSLCFWSGAFEAFSIEYAELEKAPGLLDHFFHLDQAVVSVAILICGFTGSYLASSHLGNGYLAGLSSFAVVTVILLFLPENTIERSRAKSFRERSEELAASSYFAVCETIRHPALVPLFVASIAVQFSIQPLLHYWQPFFESIRPGLSTTQLGVVFSTYTAVCAGLGFIYARNTHIPFLRSYSGTVSIFAVFSFFYLLLAVSHEWWIAVGLFAATQGVLSLGRTSLMARINEQTSSESRARVLSSVSLFSRFGMMAALLILPHLIDGQDIDPVHTTLIYKDFSVLSLVAVVVLMLAFVLRGEVRKWLPGA